jgi:putative spermidine/putrescine transport system substrate-binding protein
MAHIIEPTRRQFLASSAAVFGGAAIASVAGCSSSGGSGGAAKNVVYAGFGGTYDQNVKKYMFTPFTKQTGITVTMTADAPDPIAPIQAQVNSGHPEWDFMILNTATLAESIRDNLVQKVDYSKIPNAKNLAVSGYRNPYGPSLWVFSSNICWNTNAVKQPLNGWADFWNLKDFPGKRCLPNNDPLKTLSAALLADGVEPAKLFPLDVDRALASLDRIRSSTVFLDINTETNQLAQQDIVIALQNITRIKLAIKDKIPLAYNWKQYLCDVSTYGLLRGAAHADNFYSLTNFVLSDAVQSIQPSEFGYTPATTTAIAKVPASLASGLPASAVTGPEAIHLSAFAVDWAAEGEQATTAFTNWLQS